MFEVTYTPGMCCAFKNLYLTFCPAVFTLDEQGRGFSFCYCPPPTVRRSLVGNIEAVQILKLVMILN